MSYCPDNILFMLSTVIVMLAFSFHLLRQTDGELINLSWFLRSWLLLCSQIFFWLLLSFLGKNWLGFILFAAGIAFFILVCACDQLQYSRGISDFPQDFPIWNQIPNLLWQLNTDFLILQFNLSRYWWDLWLDVVDLYICGQLYDHNWNQLLSLSWWREKKFALNIISSQSSWEDILSIPKKRWQSQIIKQNNVPLWQHLCNGLCLCQTSTQISILVNLIQMIGKQGVSPM